MFNTTDIAIRDNLAAIISTYNQALAEVEDAYSILEQAQEKLRKAFIDGKGYSFNVIERNNYGEVGKSASDKIKQSLQKSAWSHVVERMSLRRMLSIKRRDELDSQIDKGELPELTVENVVALFTMSAENANVYLSEAVEEVYNFLRPCSSKYKTNTEFELEKKVVLEWIVQEGYGKSPFRVNHHRDKYLTAIDNVFAMLDGKPPVKTYHGELYDAICSTEDGTGKTQYFKFRCFKNGNLHLEFLRPDLVERFNVIAGGNRLKANN